MIIIIPLRDINLLSIDLAIYLLKFYKIFVTLRL